MLVRRVRSFPLAGIVALVVIGASGCRPPAVSTATALPTPRSTASPVAATVVVTADSAPPPTSTSIPTSVPITSTSLARTEATPVPLAIGPGLVAVFPAGAQAAQCLGVPAFSPDGRLVALACDVVRIWDVQTGALIRELDNPYPGGCTLSKAAFSPDSRVIAINISSCWTDRTSTGQIVVWDVETGTLLQDIAHDHARLVDPRQDPYTVSLGSMVFLPASSRLAYGSGNGIEIRDLRSAAPPVKLDLGIDMVATELSVSVDGRWLFVLMRWDKTNDFPSNYTTVYRAQTWDLDALKPIRLWDYPVTKPMERPIELAGNWAVQDDPEAGTTTAADLLTGETHAWPFRRGWRYLSADGAQALWFRNYGFPAAEQAIEVWETDTWREVDSFRPDLGEDWYWLYREVAFSPDRSLVAIAYEDHLALWRLRTDRDP